MSTDADAMTVTAAAVTTSANITTGLGADTLTGSAGNDTLRGNNAADQITGGDGADSITLTETVSAADLVIVNAVVGTSSESIAVTVTGNDNDKGEDTITGYTHSSDIIRIVSTGQTAFVHATDTGIGTADAAAAATGIAGDYAITAGLVDLDNDGLYNGADDVVINFSSPSAALTETNFEASLQYFATLANGGIGFTSGGQADSITGGTGTDTIGTAGGADTVDGGTGADIIDVGAGLDTVQVNAGDTVLTVGGANNSGTITGFSVVTGLAAATGAAVSETLDVQGTASLAASANGIDGGLKIANALVKSINVANGIATFDDADTFQTAIGVTTDAHVAAVVSYLQANDLGNAGATATFIGTGGDTFVFTQGDNSGTNNLDTLVKLVGVAADKVKLTNAVGANDLFIA
jgi:Ca2+-binding RTX toxin-like protein